MAAGSLPIGRKRQKKQHVSYKKATSDAMIIRTSVKTPTTNVRKCLRAFLAATLFVLSALMQATVAPHEALSATQQLCVKISDAAPAEAWTERIRQRDEARLACALPRLPIATAPIIPKSRPLRAPNRRQPPLLISLLGLSNRENDADPAKRARVRLPRSPDETNTPF